MQHRVFGCQFMVGSLIGLGCCFSGMAYSDQLNEIYDMDLEQLLDVEISIATRSRGTVISSPSTVTVFTDQEIKRMGIESLEMLLNYVSGFQTARSDDDNRPHTAAVRGRRSTSSGFDILVLQDGLRLNDFIYGGAFGQDALISLEHIKQVEIIRGPGSALYGSNAYTAVINMVSKPASDKLSLSSGTFAARKATIELSRDWLGLNWSAYGRYYQDDGEQYPAFYNFLGLEIPTSDRMKHSDIYLRGYSEQWEVYLRQSKRVFSDFIISGALATSGQRLKLDNRSARVVYHYKPTQTLTISPYADYVDSDNDSLLSQFPAEPDVMPNFHWTNGDKVASMGGNIRTTHHKRVGFDGSWQWDDDHLFSFGALWRQESVGLNPFHGNWDSQLLFEQNIFAPHPDGPTGTDEGFWIDGVRFDLFTPQQRNVLGLYLQDQWQVNSSLSFTSGVRYDEYDDFGGNLSIRGGLVYHPAHHRTLKLLYGEAFRAPTFVEARAGLASGGISNPNLKPETVKTYELAWFEKYSWGRISATYFLNRLEDTIVAVKIADTVTGLTATTPQNTVDVDISGIEIEADIQLASDWIVKAGVSHLLKDKSDEPVADETAFVVLNYASKWTEKPLNFNFAGYYHAKVLSRQAEGELFDNNVYLDSFWDFRLSAHYAISDECRLSLTIDNLFDQDFTTYSRQIGIDNGLPTRGRSVLAGIEYEF